MVSTKTTSAGNPATQGWPTEGLERVEHCPVCGSTERESLHTELEDTVFFCAPGRWNQYECAGCGSVYLDPRPTPETIHLAYGAYYTHASPQRAGGEGPGTRRRLLRALANGYRNHRFGTRDVPASRLGILAGILSPAHRRRIDGAMRHLPRARPGDRLLDVGCGSGGFLQKARSAGWEVVGADFDRQAVAVAQAQGLDVLLGGVEAVPGKRQFAIVTLNHVIEHVHDPVHVLKACYDLLRPGGLLWLETPNVESLGHRRYGRHWRGLEPPRHLVLFTRRSLFRGLDSVGFLRIKDMPYVPICAHRFLASKAIAEGCDPYEYDASNLTPDDIAMIKHADRAAVRDPTLRESITVTARKPA